MSQERERIILRGVQFLENSIQVKIQFLPRNTAFRCLNFFSNLYVFTVLTVEKCLFSHLRCLHNACSKSYVTNPCNEEEIMRISLFSLFSLFPCNSCVSWNSWLIARANLRYNAALGKGLSLILYFS